MGAIRKVLRHMFSWKAVRYRIFTMLWTLFSCYVWTGNLLESTEVTATIVAGKFIYYGVNEFLHERRNHDE